MSDGKPDHSTPPAPLVHPGLAFVSAGVSCAAAGYLLTTTDAFTRLYMETGMALPALVEVVVSLPRALPAALLVSALLVLVMGGWHVRRSAATSTLRAFLHAGTLGVALVGFSAVGASALVFVALEEHLR